jgi:single-strand DNA-binding protein
MINKVILVGNLGKDPEVRHLEGGTKVATFSVATNENYKDKAGEWQTVTQWHNIVAWRGGAEIAERRLKKGSLVYIEGKLSHRQYQDKENNTRYITEVVSNVLRPLEKREDPTPGGYSESLPSSQSNQPMPSDSAPKKIDDFDDDDLPF